MGKYYDHSSELKHRTLAQIASSGGGLTASEISGLKKELAETQLYRYRRQGLLCCKPIPNPRRGRRTFRYYITKAGRDKLNFFNKVERIQRERKVSWKEAINQKF